MKEGNNEMNTNYSWSIIENIEPNWQHSIIKKIVSLTQNTEQSNSGADSGSNAALTTESTKCIASLVVVAVVHLDDYYLGW